MLGALFASLAAKVAAGGLAVAMASTGAVAATGNLPDAVQTTVSEAVDNIGINIPLGETEALAQEDSTDVEGDRAKTQVIPTRTPTLVAAFPRMPKMAA